METEDFSRMATRDRRECPWILRAIVGQALGRDLQASLAKRDHHDGVIACEVYSPLHPRVRHCFAKY